MNLRKARLKKGWSQQQVAEMTGLSVRTVQRIERGAVPGLESRKALAAVFDTTIDQWQKEPLMATGQTIQDPTGTASETPTETPDQEQQAIEYVRDLKGFYVNLFSYAAVITFLFFINWLSSPGYWWVVWPALGWGFGLLIQGINVYEVFDLFGARWERKQVEKRLGRKL